MNRRACVRGGGCEEQATNDRGGQEGEGECGHTRSLKWARRRGKGGWSR